jgi:hypothetical protein
MLIPFQLKDDIILERPEIIRLTYSQIERSATPRGTSSSRDFALGAFGTVPFDLSDDPTMIERVELAAV